MLIVWSAKTIQLLVALNALMVIIYHLEIAKNAMLTAMTVLVIPHAQMLVLDIMLKRVNLMHASQVLVRLVLIKQLELAFAYLINGK